MSDALTVAKAQVRDMVQELRAMEFRLLGVQASLPPSPADKSRFQDVDEMDPITELRGVIGCVLHESIRPAIQDLEAAAGQQNETSPFGRPGTGAEHG
jgi:hypothetical protein